MDFKQEFIAKFGEKYSNLSLKNVVVKKREGVCIITFLYPSTVKELSDDEKREITNFFLEKLNLEKMSVRVKFLRVFVEERLIKKSLLEFFQNKYKLVMTYISEESFKIQITNIDVIVKIELSRRMCEFFAEHKIVGELIKYLKDNFLVEFSVDVVENENLIDEVDIENVQMKTAYRIAQRHSVEIVKEIVGTKIPPMPEWLSFITSPKESVIVAGFIKKIERRDFIVKSGKHLGEQKAYYTFSIEDGKGKLDCIYFCPHRNEQLMDSLEECMYLLLHGDVRLNQQGKLCLYVDKLALANVVEQEELPENEPSLPGGNVVEIEKLTSLSQDSMFEQKDRYNSKIMGKNIVVFDIETTGLDPNTDQIIELGAVKIENGNIVEKFSTFVKPTKKIPFEVVNITGITDEMVENAPPIDFVIKEFYDFTRGCTISGHNVINFDIKFIRREGSLRGLDFDNPLIDTMNEVRTSRLKLSRLNLSAVVKALGLTLEGAHRAWNDAYATAQVLLRLNEI